MRTPLKWLLPLLMLLLACAAPAQISMNQSLTPKGWAGQRLHQIQWENGYVRVMCAGDSIMDGSSRNDGALRVPIALGLKLHGIDPVLVGEVSGNSSGDAWFYNTFGNVTKYQAVGGITSLTLLNGNGSSLSALATALAAQKPDAFFVCIGSNDTSPGVQGTFQAIIDACYAYRQDMPVVFYTPYDTNSTAVEYYNVDTARAATKETIRAACLARPNAPIIFVDSAQALGQWTWYPIDGTGYVPSSTDTGAETVTFGTDKQWRNGQEVTPSATVGGLTAGTTYYLNRASAATFSFHTTRANAMSGASKVNLTASITATIIPNVLNAQNNNANSVFADSAHLQQPSWALIASAGLAEVFGTSSADELRLLSTAQPYAPIDFPDNGQDIASGSSAVLIPGGPYKRCATSLTVYNSDTSATATITVSTRRVSGDGTTVGTDATWMTFKVPAGVTVGWTWQFSSDPSNRTCPTAFYNEGWKVAVSGATCNVRMSGKSTVF